MAGEEVGIFEAIFAATPTPLLVLKPDGEIVAANDRYGDLSRTAGQELAGRGVTEALPIDASATEWMRGSVARVARTGASDTIALLQVEPGAETGGRSERFWCCTHVPLRDKGGAIAFVLQNAQEVSEADAAAPSADAKALAAGSIGTRVLDRAERVQALNMSLLAESAQLRNLFMRAPSFMCLMRGADYRFELVNSAFMDLVGQRQLLGRTFREALPEVDGQLYLDLLDKVYQTGEPFVGKQMRAELERSPGQGPEEVFISFVFQPILGENGEVLAIFVDGNDVTDHVRAERSQALLVRELHHRVRNTLATVQGVMNSTARTAETIEDYQWAFSGRISSLARTHSLLTEEIQQFVSFPHLLRQEIGVYAEGATDRVVLEGPDVELPSQLAVPLGMTIHELTTNAYRHGALSTPDGCVTVTWSVQPSKDKRILICRWTETGGPAVLPPARQGFGSMILTRVLSQQIGAKVDTSYLPAGFELRADIPLVLERV